MPHIWMTYEELGSLFNCEPGAARTIAITMRLARRISRDGNTRVRLNAELTERWLDKRLGDRIERALRECADDLRAVRERMAGCEDPVPGPVPRALGHS